MKKRTRWLLAGIVTGLLLIPGVALATHVFLDVDDQSVHFEGIQFMKDSGVSVGCKDGTVFCPGDPVTREQMATFMYRLSGNDPDTPPAVNAASLNGHDGSEFPVAFSVPVPLGEEVTLATDGTIEFFATCREESFTRYFDVYVRSSVDGTFTDDGTLAGTTLSAGVPFLVYTEPAATPTTGYFASTGRGVAMTPDGSQLSITIDAYGYGVAGSNCVATGTANYAQPVPAS